MPDSGIFDKVPAYLQMRDVIDGLLSLQLAQKCLLLRFRRLWKKLLWDVKRVQKGCISMLSNEKKVFLKYHTPLFAIASIPPT